MNKISKNIEYYDSGNKLSESWMLNGILHNPKGVAFRKFYDTENSELMLRAYYTHGKLHRENGPALVAFYQNGKKEEEHYCKDGKLHRKNGPARKSFYENGKVFHSCHYVNGMKHKENGPAFKCWDNGRLKSEIYYLNGKKHRLDGPAIIEYWWVGNKKSKKTFKEHYYINGEWTGRKLNNGTIQDMTNPDNFFGAGWSDQMTVIGFKIRNGELYASKNNLDKKIVNILGDNYRLIKVDKNL